MTVAEIQKGTKFEGFLLVREAAKRLTAAGKAFLDLTLCDMSGSIPGKVWGAETEPPEPGSVVFVQGVGDEFVGKAQLRVDFMRAATEEDGVSVGDFVPRAPEDSRVMLNEVLERMNAIGDAALRNMVAELLKGAYTSGLLTFPAAKQMHHAELSGLLHHVTSMLRAGAALCGVYPQLNRDLLTAGIIVHDLGKIDEMVLDSTGLVSDYSADGRLLGHIVRGVANVQKAGEAVGAPQETIMLLQHMIVAHHGEAEFGSPVPPKIPEAEVLSTLDRLDARLFQMEEALRDLAPGSFSPKIWSLNRELYKA